MDDGWSAVAGEWSALWGASAAPVWRAIAAEAGVGAGTRLLDVGCGSGELLAFAESLGATVAGIDPAPGMIALAAAGTERADLRLGGADDLPWPDGAFDVVSAVNALQFADDTVEALIELARVTVPGGVVAVANWAEGSRNDLDVIEAAVAEAAGEESAPDGDLREAGGLERLVADAGLELVASRVVAVPLSVPDAPTLVRTVLLGEDAAGLASGAATVLAAAEGFRADGGGYTLANAFRLVVARVPRSGL